VSDVSRYKTVAVRVPSLVAEQCRRIALKGGWEFSDLTRTFVCVASFSTFLTLRNPEQLDMFKTKAVFSRVPYFIAMALKKPGPGRPYNPRGNMPTSVITLRIPESLSSIIVQYAEVSGVSRNQTYSDFLQKGLMIFLKAENALLKAILSLPKDVGARTNSHS